VGVRVGAAVTAAAARVRRRGGARLGARGLGARGVHNGGDPSEDACEVGPLLGGGAEAEEDAVLDAGLAELGLDEGRGQQGRGRLGWLLPLGRLGRRRLRVGRRLAAVDCQSRRVHLEVDQAVKADLSGGEGGKVVEAAREALEHDVRVGAALHGRRLILERRLLALALALRRLWLWFWLRLRLDLLAGVDLGLALGGGGGLLSGGGRRGIERFLLGRDARRLVLGQLLRERSRHALRGPIGARQGLHVDDLEERASATPDLAKERGGVHAIGSGQRDDVRPPRWRNARRLRLLLRHVASCLVPCAQPTATNYFSTGAGDHESRRPSQRTAGRQRVRANNRWTSASAAAYPMRRSFACCSMRR
jgi:hypothetical protein